MKKIYLIVFVMIISFTILFAIELNQWDNFQDGTLQGWLTGGPNPNSPEVITDGGPEGTGDAYLLLTSTGSSFAGGRLAVFNNDQWTGDYTTAGVSFISMHMNNFSTSDLNSILKSIEFKPAKLYSIRQLKNSPPEFEIIVKNPEAIKDAEKGQLINIFRKKLNLEGVPVIIKFRKKHFKTH